MLDFSVLVCTCNRHALLAQCLAALGKCDELPDEIVIVNGGDERADAVVNAFRETVAGKVEIKLVKTINKNLAASRNIGLPHCTGDIIAMTDDDAEVFPDWVMQMKRAHAAHPEAGAVGGAVLGADQDSLVSRIADHVTFPSPSSAAYVRTLPGVNISYKRDAVQRVGPQDETLFRGEDVDYNWRVKKLGYEIWYDPAVRVLHHHRPTLRKFLNQHYMYGRAYYLVRRKWQDMYCVYPHQLRTARDFLKLANFVAAVFYLPLISAQAISPQRDRVLALPLLFLVGICWRGGMVRQKLITLAGT